MFVHLVLILTSFASLIGYNKGTSSSPSSSSSSSFLPDFKPEFKHHDYEALEAFLARMNKEHPEITRLYSAGKSVENRQLYVLEISDNPGRHEPGIIQQPHFICIIHQIPCTFAQQRDASLYFNFGGRPFR